MFLELSLKFCLEYESTYLTKIMLGIYYYTFEGGGDGVVSRKLFSLNLKKMRFKPFSFSLLSFFPNPWF